MKILIFNTFYYPTQVGGAEKSVQFIAEGLKAKGHEVIVVSTSSKDYIDIVNGVKVYYVNTNNIYWSYYAKEKNRLLKPFWHMVDTNNLFTKHKIEKIIKDEKPDVVHTNNLAGFSDIVWKITKKYKIRLVHTLRDYYQLCPKSTMFKNDKNCISQCLSCKIYSIPKKSASSLVDAVVGVSQFILDKHLNYGYFQNAITKINIFNPVPLPKNIVKNKSSKIRLGLVGLMSKSKGTEFILEEFRRLSIKNLELHIYGKGESQEYEQLLIDKINKTSNITFHGFKKVEEIYQNIDILIISSLWHEPFPRTLIEAMSYQTLVLATNRGGTNEMIEDGKNGYIFDPNIPTDFRNKIELILEMYRNNEFEFDLSAFGYDEIINKYLKVYKN